MGHSLTSEQLSVVDGVRCGEDLVVEAGAGTGKTTSLLAVAQDNTHRRSLYLAYNAVTAREARGRFPRSVECLTAHALARRTAPHWCRDRLEMPRQPGRRVAEVLGIRGPHRVNASRVLAPWQVAGVVTDTVGRFCTSADPEVAGRHVPPVKGMEDPASHSELSGIVLPLARRAWADVRSQGGELKVTHDHYLKLWQLDYLEGRGRPFDYDLVMYDEVQDADAATADVVGRQTHVQRVLVGDRNQALYQWRGSVDAMHVVGGKRLALSQSFRFGPVIAAEANVWLSLLGADLRLTGSDRVVSTVGPSRFPPTAILCRTNATAVAEAVQAMEAGRKVALARGAEEIRRMAQSAIALKQGQPAAHRDLIAFQTWAEVQTYVDEEPSGSDLKVFVALVEEHTPEGVIAVIDALVGEEEADVVVSTAHSAKGREWPTVWIACDFREPTPDRPSTREELMLAYVACTRAQNHLDPDGLSWVHELDWLVPSAPAEEAAV